MRAKNIFIYITLCNSCNCFLKVLHPPLGYRLQIQFFPSGMKAIFPLTDCSVVLMYSSCERENEVHRHLYHIFAQSGCDE